jgi:hypothetical protein
VKHPVFPIVLAGLIALLAGGAAAERAAARHAARAAREAAHRELEDALLLARRHPQAFGFRAAAPGESSLKSAAQEAAARRGLVIGALSESEREIDAGRRERQVLVRLLDAPHAELVRYLADLEGAPGGARVKELHLRPSESRGGAYEEAEVVMARVSAEARP